LRQSVELLTTAQVARRLKQSEEVVRRKARSGELPAFRLGSGPRAPLRFDAAELTEWLYREPARESATPSRARAVVPAEPRAPNTGQSITRQPAGPLEAV
jgi:excisionase family DNA binding protein